MTSASTELTGQGQSISRWGLSCCKKWRLYVFKVCLGADQMSIGSQFFWWFYINRKVSHGFPASCRSLPRMVHDLCSTICQIPRLRDANWGRCSDKCRSRLRKAIGFLEVWEISSPSSVFVLFWDGSGSGIFLSMFVYVFMKFTRIGQSFNSDMIAINRQVKLSALPVLCMGYNKLKMQEDQQVANIWKLAAFVMVQSTIFLRFFRHVCWVPPVLTMTLNIVAHDIWIFVTNDDSVSKFWRVLIKSSSATRMVLFWSLQFPPLLCWEICAIGFGNFQPFPEGRMLW